MGNNYKKIYISNKIVLNNNDQIFKNFYLYDNEKLYNKTIMDVEITDLFRNKLNDKGDKKLFFLHNSDLEIVRDIKNMKKLKTIYDNNNDPFIFVYQYY